MTDGRKHLDTRKATFKLLSCQIQQIFQISAQHFPSRKLIFVSIGKGYSFKPVRIADPAFDIIENSDILIPVILLPQRFRVMPKHKGGFLPLLPAHTYKAWDDFAPLYHRRFHASIRQTDPHGGIGASEIDDQREFRLRNLFFLNI